MSAPHTIADAGLYTDFSELSRLKGEAANQSATATDKVAKQFESLFMQMMLKSMREASTFGDSVESDQTRFYQEMFDKQVALQMVNNNGGIGLSEQLKIELSGEQAHTPDEIVETDSVDLVTRQISGASSVFNRSAEAFPPDELE